MTYRPLIKMCGFTCTWDVQAAVTAGADLIGLVHHPKSPRHVETATAKRLAEAARSTPRPPITPSVTPTVPVTVVAVMVDPDERAVRTALNYADIIQFHGDESPTFCAGFGHPYMRAHRLRSPEDASRIDAFLAPPAWAFLVDAFCEQAHGGTGKRLSPELLDAALTRPRGFLAGGLSPQNVADVIERWRPYGVDVSSGIEARPGVKDAEKMKQFVRGIGAAKPLPSDTSPRIRKLAGDTP